VSGPKPPGPIKRIPAWVKGVVVLAVGFFLMYAGLRLAYGGFGDYYLLSVDLPRSGQQLEKGSDVRMSGVIVGEVTEVRLVDRHVRVTLQMDQQYKVPDDSEAFVTLTTLLGAKYVDLRFPSFDGPYLADGGRIATAHVGPELEDALADGVSVLEAIRPVDLAVIVTELAEGARGHGEDVALGIQYNTELTRLFARTLDEQLESLHDFTVVFGALRNSGIDLNDLADATNEGVPVYASAEAQDDLHAALLALVPFSDNLADLLILDRASWDVMIDAGDEVLGTIAARPQDLERLVHGLYQYVFKLGGAPDYIDVDGSAQAGFVAFIGGTDAQETRAQLCDALPVEVRNVVPICGGTPE
jgi:virulence factor Mce-like protein